VAFRFGHSLLSGGIERQDNNGADITDNPGLDAALSLATDFFDPNVLNPNGVTDPLTGHISTDIDAYLKADADGVSNAMDVLAINEVRNLLFANGGLTDNGQDLIARDIQRARDDGIGTYNQLRVAFGLQPVTKFSQITSNVTVQNELKAAYGSVDKIDPFEGGLAEDHVSGSDMGPLFTAILAKQFAALRDGDRFFYLNESFTTAEQNILDQGDTLTKVIEANTGITNLQADAIRFQASISGTVFNDLNGNGTQDSGDGALSGRVIELEDAAGNVLATTTTDRNGHYAFSSLNGIATGQYQVAAASLPNGWTMTTAEVVGSTFTAGDQSFTVNFGEVKHIRSGTAPSAAASSGSGAQSSAVSSAGAAAAPGAVSVVSGPTAGGLAASFVPAALSGTGGAGAADGFLGGSLPTKVSGPTGAFGGAAALPTSLLEAQAPAAGVDGEAILGAADQGAASGDSWTGAFWEDAAHTWTADVTFADR
jgi:hypothetical protein